MNLLKIQDFPRFSAGGPPAFQTIREQLELEQAIERLLEEFHLLWLPGRPRL
jgi:hypothetical protein